jgi:hypothetical protein
MNIDSDNDPRLSQLREWLITVLPHSSFRIEVASSDASFRRYFRVWQDETSLIVMDAPPQHEDSRPFVTIARFLGKFHIHVPEIIACDLEQGFLLLSDLGNKSYLSQLNDDSADKLYQAAIDEIIKMQQTPVNDINLPPYDQTRLQQEMDLFPEWFLGRHLSLTAPACLADVFTLLLDNAEAQPQFFVHRDYHSRNLMLADNQQVGVIDFQDAVVGPASYDLVSLLRDCYIAWPQPRLDAWLDYYLEQAEKAGLFSDISRSRFKRWFDLMGLQRHLKVLGIFCRLNYRDGKAGYMADLPLTLRYVLQVTSSYPELDALHAYLTDNPEIMAIQ